MPGLDRQPFPPGASIVIAFIGCRSIIRPALAYGVAGDAVSTPTDGDREPVTPAEAHRGRYIRCTHRHRAMNARLRSIAPFQTRRDCVEPFVARGEQFPGEPIGECREPNWIMAPAFL